MTKMIKTAADVRRWLLEQTAQIQREQAQLKQKDQLIHKQDQEIQQLERDIQALKQQIPDADESQSSSSEEDSSDESWSQRSGVCENEATGEGSSGDDKLSYDPGRRVFCPVDAEWQRGRCRDLELTMTTVYRDQSSPSRSLGPPCKMHEIESDGNCLFRCLALVLTGEEANHMAIRGLVVDHMSKIPAYLEMFLPEGVQSMEEYIRRTHMRSEGKWGTIVEIYSASHLLRTDIYTYSNQGAQYDWNKVSAADFDLDLKPHNRAIYIAHVDDVHFNLVCEIEDESSP